MADNNGFTVDWTRLQVADWATIAKEPGRIDNQVRLLTLVVTACPWGDPADEATYINDEMTVADFERFADEVVKRKPKAADLSELARGGELVVDWNRLSTAAMQRWQRQAADVESQVAVLRKVVTACPWGDPADEDTYMMLDLPTYEGLWEAAAAARRDKFR